MTRRRPLLIIAMLLVAAAWYLFRPELLFIDRTAQEAPPLTVDTAPLLVVASGEFRSDEHETAGRARLTRTGAATVLRLERFSTSNGPDVRVYLVAADSVPDSRTVKGADVIDLGALKGNLGDQSYAVPLGTDLSRYRAVSIWCRRFSVNFGSAALHSAVE